MCLRVWCTDIPFFSVSPPLGLFAFFSHPKSTESHLHTVERWRQMERKKTDTFRRQSHREINEFRILSSFTSPLKTQINTFLSLARSLAINFHFNHSFLHKQMEFFSIEKFSNSESWWMCLYDFYCYIKEVEWKQKWNRLNKVLVRNELREKEEGQIDTDNV